MAGEPQKIAFELDRKDNDRLNTLIPWGMKAHIFRKMTTMLLDILETIGASDRGGVLAAIIEGDLVLVPRRKLVEWQELAKNEHRRSLQAGQPDDGGGAN